MNLERVIPQDSNYMVLKKISEFTNKYLCVDISESSQKTNNGDTILAFDEKNIEQFKGKRRFFVLDEKNIVENIEKKGIKDIYKYNIYQGDLVSYNGLKYVVLGIVINNYAQWNIPTPFLLNTNDIAKDYSSLYSSRMSDFEINETVNNNFQSGKYDNDMLIPLIDLNEKTDDFKIIERRPSISEVQFQLERYNQDKNLTLKAKKNIFIDTILNNRMPEIDSIRENNEELYESMKKLITSVNSSINKKIEKINSEKKGEELDLISQQIELESLEKEAEDLFEDKIKKSEEKEKDETKFKKEQTKTELKEIPDKSEIKIELVEDLPLEIQKLYLQRQKEAGNKFNLKISVNSDNLNGGFMWVNTPEGIDFWDKIDIGNFIFFKEKYGKYGEKVDYKVNSDVLEFINKHYKLTKKTKETPIVSEEQEASILKPGVTGYYGKNKDKITIISITPKIVNFVNQDGKKKGIYIENFLKNFIKETK